MSFASLGPTGPQKPAFEAGSITLKQVQELLAPFNDRYGPTVTLATAAELAGLAPATIKKLVCEGFFRKSVARGKPLLFLRDLFVWERMNLQRTREARRRLAPRLPATHTEGNGHEAD